MMKNVLFVLFWYKICRIRWVLFDQNFYFILHKSIIFLLDSKDLCKKPTRATKGF